MDIDEFEPHQIIYSFSTVIMGIIFELIMVFTLESAVDDYILDFNNISLYIVFSFIFYCTLLILGVPKTWILPYLLIYNLVLKKDYKASLEKSIGSGEMYMSATITVSILIGNKISQIIARPYLILISLIIFYPLFKFYKRYRYI